MKIYFAGPLFSEPERNWIRGAIDRIHALTAELNHPVNIISPFELISTDDLMALGDETKRELFDRCRTQLDTADLLIALLDGPQVDDGTAWEIGYFYAIRRAGTRIIGIRTDSRRAGEFKNSLVNAMVECSCDRIANSLDELMGFLRGVFLGNGE